ncbi:MAG TPA: hypothetical protein VJ723_06575, partial [Candidatus Angelobacter sp.]|nr:hypothetical protein [Candidatus Angelobacter sp.]
GANPPDDFPTDRHATLGPKRLRPSSADSNLKEAASNSEALQPAFNSGQQSRMQGRSVSRSPERLHLHPAFLRLNLAASVAEFNAAIRMKGQLLREPIRITTTGIILTGFGEWHAAISDALPVVDCIEYSIGEEESLQVILHSHQPRHTWNDFTRIRLALELGPTFQLKALENQSAGGKFKGWANLPKAEHMDVRREIAEVAGVGSRNVNKVKTILKKANPRLIEALHNGTLSIHRATNWCALPWSLQVEAFTRYSVEHATNKVTRQAIAQLRLQRTRPDSSTVLHALQRREALEPGSVVVRAGRHQRTVILIAQDLLSELQTQTGSKPA